ncbi:MAG: MarR family transcriptional regulator [Burkholderiaceae bacterium]|nr:MarR family transcriptional regulator [Burkholderiaceae bacterium]
MKRAAETAEARTAGVDSRTAGAQIRSGQRVSFGLLPQVLGYHLRRTQVAIFRHFSRTVGAEMDITPGLLGMLQVIEANPGLAQSRLAEAMEVDRSAIVKVVDQLAGRGLIVREPSPHDKRSYSIRLTDSGATALRRMKTLMLRHEDEFTAVLTAEERRQLIELLARLHGGR